MIKYMIKKEKHLQSVLVETGQAHKHPAQWGCVNLFDLQPSAASKSGLAWIL